MKLKQLTIQTHKKKKQETGNIAENKNTKILFQKVVSREKTKKKNVANNKDLPFTPRN